MKWAIGISLLAFVGCTSERVESPCDFAAAIPVPLEFDLLRLSSSEEQLCIQLLQHNNSESDKFLLQFQLDQNGTTIQQQSLTFLYWTEDDKRDKYWAYAGSVDYIVSETATGDYELNTYNSADGRLLSGPTLLRID